jgi:hypothetical protein
LRLLCFRQEWPSCRRASNRFDEIAPSHRRPRDGPSYRINQQCWKGYVRFGSKADTCAATSRVRFTPVSDRESGHPKNAMSALPPKADMCGARANVCYGPIADISVALFDHLVGALQERFRDRETKRFGGFEIDDELILRRELNR